jgi:uncharacterized repeat protein (TIGR01451 family)/fimbrial isopeptide formation D2 family protein
MVATNISAGTNLYNLTFTHELPTGVTYVPGSTAPTPIGNPRIIVVTTTPDPLFPLDTVDHQVLIWSNVSDLVAGSSSSLSFAVHADPTLYPVGSTFDKTSNAYANTDPRYLPKFNPTTGAAITGATSYTHTDTVSPQNTQVAAIDIQKTNPNPESELVRGVHAQTSTFTITARNTDQADTESVVIVDYLPAGLEFLGCGGIDNSSAREFPGAPALTATPTPANCLTPNSVSTVLDPAGQPSGIYTRIEWQIGTLTAAAPTNVRTIRYAVAVPLYANTMTFPSGTPTAASLTQTANLDNNTGSSTRHIGAAASFRNAVTATGTYTGPVAPTASSTVTSSASNTVRAMDIAVTTTASSSNFVAAQPFTYTMLVRTGEYASASAITLTDTVPNGICPLVPAGTTIFGTLPPDCAAVGTVSGATINSVTANPDGTFTIDFAIIPATLTPNSTINVQYTALFRANYTGSEDPTASGDTFATGTSISGTTTPVSDTGFTTTEFAFDGSGTSHASSTPTIEKLVLPRQGIANVNECRNAYGQYVADASTIPGGQFVQGDRICFQLKINFSDTVDTRNAQITDFVPVGTSYESYTLGTPTEGSTVPAGQVSTPSDPDVPVWRLGAPLGTNPDNLFIARGSVLVMFVSAIVDDPSPTTSVDITANLMKYSQENTSGQVYALRAQADFAVAPAPTLGITKGISAVNGSANTLPYPSSGTLTGGQYADFVIDVNHQGSQAAGNDQDITEHTVWDALPEPLTCANITNISAAGTCTDNFAGFAGSANVGRSAITWTVATTLTAGSVADSLTYRVTLPSPGLTPDTDYINATSVTSYRIDTTSGSSAFYPEDSLDLGAQTSWNVAAANATATITTPAVTVAKSYTTPAVTSANTATNAVAGELITYTYSVTIPARTTVYNATLDDSLPANLVSLPSTTTSTTVPNGVTTYTAGVGYSTAFEASYTNNTDTAQTFTTTLVGVQVAPAFTGTSIANTATFRSDSAPTGGTALTPVTATSTLPVIRPRPTISKTVTPSTVSAGQTVTYTLTANNTAGNPAGYDSIIIDCLPTAITFLADVTLPSGVTRNAPTPGTGTGAGQNGCANTTNLIQYNLGTINPATPIVIQFSATVSPTAAGLATQTNTARVLTSTLDNGTRDATIEGLFTSTTANATTTVTGATVTKTTTAPTATVGGTVPYTITATIPASVNFWNAAVIDTVPAGILLNQATTVVTCTVAVTLADCAADLPAGGAPLTATSTQAGWYLGSITANPAVRTVTITVDATVRDTPGNVLGGTLTNTAKLSWRNAAGSAPANAGSTFDRSTTVNAGSTAVTTIQEPQLSITKTNSDTTPNPGDTFTYTVRATNANNANTSTAYNVTVTDTVPTGVVVNPSSIGNGGTIAGAGANGGGVITWPNLTIARNVQLDLTYEATLAPSPSLTAAALTNTARITTYASLPSGGRTYTNPVPTATSTVTPQFPSVDISKATPGGTLAYAGTPFTWRLTLANDTDAAPTAGASVADVLPKHWNYVTGSALVTVGSSTTQIDPSVATVNNVQTLTWATLGGIDPGGTILITYQATPATDALVDPGSGTSIPHTNTFSAVATDATAATGNATGNYAAGPASANAFIASADLSVTKASPGTLIAGQTTSNAWTITVRNAAGSDVAVGPFQVVDTVDALPAGVTVGQPAGSGWSCTAPTVDGDFTCTRTDANDTLAEGASFPAIAVPVSVAADVPAATEILNTVSATARTSDPNLANNFDDAIQTTTVQSDLAIGKSTSGTLLAGQTATWQIDVRNLGSSVTSGITTVTDTIPAGVTNVSASGIGWSCAPPAAGNLVCQTSTSFLGFAPALIVTGDIDSSVTGDVTNVATVTGINPDPTPSNNTASTTDPVGTDTTLLLQKSLDSGTVIAGNTVQYRLDVNNAGRADARNVIIVDPLPNGLTFAGNVTSIVGTWSCTETNSTPSTVTCILSGTLPASGSDTASVSFAALVPSSLPLGTQVENTATASADNATDVSDSATGEPLGESDLALVKALTSSSPVAGGTATYRLDVTNYGPTDNVGSITVTETPPAGFRITAIAGSGWTCSTIAGGASATCSWDTGLVANASATAITVTATIAPSVSAGEHINTASAAGISDYADPNLANNTDDAAATVSTDSALTIVKSGEATLIPGTATSYTITVTNAGPSNATDVLLADLLPPGITATALTGSGWSCSLATATCEIASLPVGSSSILVDATVAANVADGAQLTNTATVEWGDSSGRDSATADFTGTAATSADLSLVKTATSPEATAGTTGTYELSVANNGPSDASGPIVITDTLPAGLTYVSATSAGDVWTCAPLAGDPQIVECTLPDGIAATGTAPLLTMEVLFAANHAGGDTINIASVDSPTDDPNPANDSSTATVTVNQRVDLAVTETLLDGTVRIGNTVTFGYEATNNGPSAANDVSVRILLPAGLADVDTAGSDPRWSCQISTVSGSNLTEIVCLLSGTLGVGETAPPLTASARIEAIGFPELITEVTVETPAQEITYVNNADGHAYPVPPLVGLNIAKTNNGPVQAGEQAHYIITVTNLGLTSAPDGFTVIDTLPETLTFRSAEGGGAACSASGRVVTCLFTDELAVNASVSVNIYVNVALSAVGAITNTAAVSTDNENLSGSTVVASNTVIASAPAPGRLSTAGASALTGTIALLAVSALIVGSALLIMGRRRRRHVA